MVSLQQGALQIFCGALGTLGFALFFFVRPKHLLLATLGGALSWLIYLLVLHGGGGVFLAALVSSMAVCFWSEALARVRKAPALIFLLPGIVPQLPGGALYYSMSALIQEDMDTFFQKGKEAGLVALGIGVGILIASEVVCSCGATDTGNVACPAKHAGIRGEQIKTDPIKFFSSGPIQKAKGRYNETCGNRILACSYQ